MSILRKEQIERVYTGLVPVLALSTNGTSVNATAAITTALTTAGFGATAVTLTNSTSESVAGLIISGLNRVQVFGTSTNKSIFKDGEKVYGKLTYSAGVYTISLFYKNAGVETVYNTGGAINIDYLISYRFKFKDLSSDFFVKPIQLYPYSDLVSTANQGRLVEEELTVGALNSISNLSYTPTAGTKVILYINGKAETNVGSTPSFGMSGTIITWSPANAEYDVKTTFKVIASYLTLQ